MSCLRLELLMSQAFTPASPGTECATCRYVQVVFAKLSFLEDYFWVASNYLLADAPRVNLNVP